MFKLYNQRWIITGLLIFLVMVTFPLWKRVLVPPAAAYVDPGHEDDEHCCVQSREYMRTSHMKLLDQWRLEAVRGNKKDYVSPKGEHFKKSLTGTCLGCHNKEEFCDNCHKAADVKLYCFDCHITEDDLKIDAEHPGAGHPGNPGQVFKAVK